MHQEVQETYSAAGFEYNGLVVFFLTPYGFDNTNTFTAFLIEIYL